jgi:hypothetical protein
LVFLTEPIEDAMLTDVPTTPRPISRGHQNEPQTPAEVELDRKVNEKRDPDALNPVPDEPAVLPVL